MNNVAIKAIDAHYYCKLLLSLLSASSYTNGKHYFLTSLCHLIVIIITCL